MLYISFSRLRKLGVCTISFISLYCTCTYLMGPNKGTLILLLWVITKIIRLKELLPIRIQEVGLCIWPDKGDMMLLRVTS